MLAANRPEHLSVYHLMERGVRKQVAGAYPSKAKFDNRYGDNRTMFAKEYTIYQDVLVMDMHTLVIPPPLPQIHTCNTHQQYIAQCSISI